MSALLCLCIPSMLFLCRFVCLTMSFLHFSYVFPMSFPHFPSLFLCLSYAYAFPMPFFTFPLVFPMFIYGLLLPFL